MAAGVSNLELDAFFKDAYLLPSVIGDGYDVLGPIQANPTDFIKGKLVVFFKNKNKEAFDKYKALFVKFKELVNTRKRVIAAAGVAPPRSRAAIAPAPAASSLAASPAINSHTKNELDNQYKKQLKELAESISDSSSLKTTIDTSVGAIAASSAASSAAASAAASEKIRRIFTEFLKIRVKGRLEKGKLLMDELFNEPYELDTRMAEVGKHPSGNNLQIIRMKAGDDILSKFKEKYAYIKEVYSEGDRKFIDTILTGLEKEKASYIPDLIYTLAKLVPEFIPFTQAGRLVKDINTYIQSGSPISPGRDELVDAVRSTAAATGEALEKARDAMDERDRLHGELEGLRDAVISASAQAKAAASEANAASAASAAAQAKAAYKLLDETNSKYFKAFDDYIQADLEYKAANKRYWDALKNFALPVPDSVTEKIKAGTIPIGTPLATAVKILELRRLNVTNVPLLKKEVEKIDKYIKAVAAVEGLRAKKDDPKVYVEKRSVVNTLFTEKGFIEFFSRHLPEGFIEKLETEANYKELLRKAIFGEELAGKKEKGGEKGEEGDAKEPEGHEGKEGAKGKKGYTEADNTYKVANLSFFDKLAGKALNKKELAEWWKKRGGKFNIGQTIPEPIVTIFTETFNLKKKSKKTVHFADNFLIEGVKGDGASLDDATSRLASSSGPAPAAAAPAPAPAGAAPAPAGAAPAPAEEISAKGFANKGVYDQEDGPPISSIDVKSGTMFEMYYLGWLDSSAPAPPAAAAPAAAAPPAPAAASAVAFAAAAAAVAVAAPAPPAAAPPAPAPPAAPAAAPAAEAPPAAPAAAPAAEAPPAPAPPAAAPPVPAPPAEAPPAPAPAPPAAAPAAAAPAAAAPAAAAPASSLSASPASSPAYTPQQKKAITKMMKSLFSFVFSDIQVRDANKEKRFHDAYRIAYTVLEKHQKIPCKAENPELHKYFKKSLEYRKEIAIRELAATKMVGQVVTPGMQDHFTQLITGLSGLITFLDNAVEGQPCIVYGDTLSGGPVQVETGSIDTRYILQVFRNHIRMRRDGAPPPGKDILMKELTLTGVPIEDVDAVYKQISDMLTDYAKLTKENPVLRDLVVLFSQIALYLQQLGDIRLELERLQRQIDKCTDKKEKERLQEELVTKEREFRVARDEVGLLEQRHREETEELEIRIAGLEEEKQRNLQRIDALNNELEECDRVRGEGEAEVARLTARIAELEAALLAAQRGRDIALARIPELEAQLLDAQKEDPRIADLTGRLAGLEAQRDAAAGRIAELEADLIEAQKEDPRIADLTGRLAASQAERDAAAGRIAELEAELLDAQKEDPRIADLTGSLAGLEAQREAAARRIRELEADLLAAQKEDPQISDLTRRLAGSQAERDAAAGRIAELEAALIEAQKEDPRIAALTVRLAGLQAEKDAATGRTAQLEAALLAAQKEDPRIAALTARMAALQAQRDAAAGRIAELEAEVGRLGMIAAGAEGKDDRIAALEKELQVCREALASANGTIATQGARITALEAEIARLREENDKLRIQNQDLEAMLLRCAEEKRKIQKQLSALLQQQQQQEPPLPVGGGGGGAPEPPPSPPPSEPPSPRGNQPPEPQPPPPNADGLVALLEPQDFIDEFSIVDFYIFFRAFVTREIDLHFADSKASKRLYEYKDFIDVLFNSIPDAFKSSSKTAGVTKFIGDLFLRIEMYGNMDKDRDATRGNPYAGMAVDVEYISNNIILLFNTLYSIISKKKGANIMNNLVQMFLKTGTYGPKDNENNKTLSSTLRAYDKKIHTYKKIFGIIDTRPDVVIKRIILIFDKNAERLGLPRNSEFLRLWGGYIFGRAAGTAGDAARLGGGGGFVPRRPQIGGGRKTSVKSLSQGMLLLFLIELRKSKQLKSAKEVQDLVNKAGKALDSIGQYELVLTILQEVMEHTNTPIHEGYTYVSLASMKKEKANALIESYNEVFDKRDEEMFKTLGTPGSFHASAPEEFEEVLGKGPFCLVLGESKGESKEETPLHGVSDEYEVVLEEKERKVLEDNGGIPLGGVIFLYLVCLNELYCDSSDEECIRPTR